MINIMLNGINKNIEKEITIENLLTDLGLSKKKIAVEKNGEVIPNSMYSNIQLKSGDRIEIIHAVGGG